MTTEPTSPLGDRAAVDRAKAAYPVLAERIDDLEDIVTPEFDRADQTAIDTQAKLKRYRLLEIAGGVVVAVFALIRLGFGDDARWAGAAAAIVAAGTGAIAIAGRRHGLERWLDNRRIAEELRSLYFRWLVSQTSGDETADDAVDDHERRRRLRSEVTRLIAVEPIRLGAELTGPVDNGTPARQTIDDQAWQLYVDARFHDQTEWLRAKSDSVRVRTHTLQWAQVVMLGAAAVYGFISGYVSGTEGRILAVPVAATAVIVGFLATVDSVTASDQLAQHYLRTVRRLDVIDRGRADGGTFGDVEEIESVLLAEHRTWHRIAEGNQQ